MTTIKGTSNTKTTMASLVATDTALVDKLPTVLPNASIVVDGETLNCKQICGVLQSELDVINKVLSLGAQYHAAVAEMKGLRPQGRKVRSTLKAMVTSTLGDTSAPFIALGYVPRKSPVANAVNKATAVVKRAATRLARHTMGPKQKAAIKGGNVTVTIEPTPAAPGAATATAPAAPAAPVAPAATGGNTAGRQ
jgi:hypothetical protein